MTPEEFYKEIRNHIKHEDMLCNHRMTWLITLQAFLFGAYGFTLSAESGPNGLIINHTITHARTGIALMGVLSSIAISVALIAAKTSIDRLIARWHRYEETNNVDDSQFPQIVGNCIRNVRGGTNLGQVPIFAIPLIFLPVWIYIQFGDTAAGIVSAMIAIALTLSLVVYVGILIGRRQGR
jgi:hypothetical protein